jgi:hypothetical protein
VLRGDLRGDHSDTSNGSGDMLDMLADGSDTPLGDRSGWQRMQRRGGGGVKYACDIRYVLVSGRAHACREEESRM